jgi:hypothetical protein
MKIGQYVQGKDTTPLTRFSYNTDFYLMPCPFTGTKMFCACPNFLSQPKNLTAFMPCPFTGPKMFCADPNFLSQPKNLTAFSASSKTFVPAQKPILLNANHLIVWHKMFVTGTICK